LRFIHLPLIAALTCGTAHATDVLNINIETAGQYEIHMWVPFGAYVDTVPGIAHVLEHLKFKSGGDKGIGGLDAIAGSSSNAATTYRYTRYDVGISLSHLSEALVALAGVTDQLKIKDEDLVGQRNVVKQELYQRYNSDPDTPFYFKFSSTLYDGTSLATLPGGTQQTVDQVDMAGVLKYDAAHYQKADRFLLIAGPELPAAAKADIKKLFPDVHFGSVFVDHKRVATYDDKELRDRPVFLPAPEPLAIQASRFWQDGTSTRIRSSKLLYSKILNAPMTWKNVLAADILDRVVESRLQEGLIDKIDEDAGLVQNFNFSVDASSQRSWKIDFSADLVEGIAPEKVIDVFETYFADLTQHGISEKTFTRVRDRFFIHDEWDDVESRMSIFGVTALQYGYSKAANEYADFHDLKVDDVNALLKSLNKDGRVGIAVLKPAGAQ
jgi:predicted Zn-dependent peptidase